MTQPLFFEPEPYLEKSASETELAEDPNKWPQDILQELYKQVPYIADFEPHVQMDRVDGEKGYGFGHVEVMNQTESQQGTPPDQMRAAGIRTVRVPIVVKSGKLQPFDVLLTDDSKVRPLTEGRLRQAVFRPQAFDVTARTPGDQSMIGQLYPPYRQNYGFGGGGVAMNAGMGKESSALETFIEKDASAVDEYFSSNGVKHGRMGKKSTTIDAKDGAFAEFVKNASVVIAEMKTSGSVLKAILPTINQEDYNKFAAKFEPIEMQAALQQNFISMGPSLEVLTEYNPVKLASVMNYIRPTVVQVRRGEGEYIVKSANHKFWNPVLEYVSRGEIIRRFGEKVALAADTEGAATMAEGEGVSEQPVEAQDAAPITESGLYKVKGTNGDEHLGFVVVNPLDMDGQPVPLAMFTNGSKAAVQTDMFGVPAGEGFDLPTGQATGHGAGFFFSPDGAGIKATVPLILSGSIGEPDGTSVFSGETFDGRPAEVSIQPNVQTVTQTPDGRTLIPQGWQRSPLESADHLDLVSAETEVSPEAEAKTSMASVFVRAGDPNSFSFEGQLLKVASEERQFLSLDDAMFLLAGLGVDLEYGIKKLGQAISGSEPVRVRIGRTIETVESQKTAAMKLAQSREIINWRRDLVKEATNIPDPVAVDTVLSLGFINPENVLTFVSYLPVLEDAQSRMCELLLAARLGLQNIPTTALEKAVRSTEEVLEGLKILAFQRG
jgi:hypothetical protein